MRKYSANGEEIHCFFFVIELLYFLHGYEGNCSCTFGVICFLRRMEVGKQEASPSAQHTTTYDAGSGGAD